jgi:hypothetical protein
MTWYTSPLGYVFTASANQTSPLPAIRSTVMLGVTTQRSSAPATCPTSIFGMPPANSSWILRYASSPGTRSPDCGQSSCQSGWRSFLSVSKSLRATAS